MCTVKIVDVGDAVGIILPPDVLAKLHVENGDTLCITETPCGFELTRDRSNSADQLETADAIMSANRDVLRKLSR